ncbi:MAG: alpha/beta hydrolase family protein [Luteibaculaceae bacterium]
MRIVLLFVLLLGSHVLSAQKRPVTVADYDSLQLVKQVNFSEKESYLWLTKYPQVGDETIILHNIKNRDTLHFPRAYQGFVTGNELFFGATLKITTDSLKQLKLKGKKKDDLPKDKLLVYAFKENQRDTFENVLRVLHTAKNLDVVAFTQEPPKDTTKTKDKKAKAKSKLKGKQLRVLSENQQRIFPNVLDFALAKEQAFILFSTEKADSAFGSTVKIFDVLKKQLITLDSGAVGYKNLSFSAKSGRLAFLATNDTVKGEEEYRLLTFMLNNKNGWVKQHELGPRITLKDGMVFTLSEHAPLDFYTTESHLFFGLKDTLVKFAYEKDSTILKEDKVSLDVWSWFDDEIATIQLKNAEKAKKQFYRASLNLRTKQTLLLTDNLTYNLQEPRDFEHPIAILADSEPFRNRMLYDFQYPQDIYYINMLTGVKKLVEKAVVAQVVASKSGEAMAYYTLTDSTWNIFNFKQEKRYQYKLNNGSTFANEIHDTPSLPYSNGFAGFTEKDAQLIVYDRFDVYALSSVKNELKSITKGEGRASKSTYRFERVEEAKNPISMDKNWLVSVFNQKTKIQTLHGFNPKNGELMSALYAGVGLHEVNTSSNSGENIVLTFQNFNQAPVYQLFNNFSKHYDLVDLQPQYTEFTWGTAEKIEWQSLQGETLEGLLYIPEGNHAVASLPLMVYFYERNSHTLHRFRTPAPSASIINIAHFVSNGYAVFVPDIVYQTGFPGKSAYDCIIPGVQAVLKHGLINPNKMAIQGQSWGGYQVAYLITQTNMFVAAGAGAPVSNMTSAYGGIRWGSGFGRLFQYEQGQSRIGATLWEAPMRYLENSPLFYADKVSTPLLMMHNDNDGAVPWYQGIEYFLALKRNNAPVWMLNYNGEEHNLMQRKNRVDLSLRLSAFFDHYLKDEPTPIWMEKGIPATLKGRTMGHGTSY